MEKTVRDWISRRNFSMLLLAGLGLPGVSGAAQPARQVGNVKTAVGGVFAQANDTRPLKPGASVLLGDMVFTDAESRAALAMEGGSNVFLGGKARLKIDRFVALSGGELVLGDGGMVFDRDEKAPKTNIQVRSVFGLIGVRGTRFFAGPNRGVFAVFCQRGEVRVDAAGQTRTLRPGDGIDIVAPGAVPGEVKVWGQARVDEALKSVLG